MHPESLRESSVPMANVGSWCPYGKRAETAGMAIFSGWGVATTVGRAPGLMLRRSGFPGRSTASISPGRPGRPRSSALPPA